MNSKNTFPASEMKLSAGGLSSPGTNDHPAALKPLQVQCAWCRMWRVDGVWVSMPLTGATGAVTHGICPPCSGEMLKGVTA